MSIIDKLASSLDRRDEIPNQELAKCIADSNDKKSVKELVESLNHKNSGVQSDCIKVLYETGIRKPQLIAVYIDEFIALLDNKNNRLQWGAMKALDILTNENPAAVYSALAKIVAVADKGSVITNDHCIGILIKFCAIPEYNKDAFSLLNERLMKSPANQLPAYAENALPVINERNKAVFIKTLSSRLDDIEKKTKRLRVEKVIKKLQNK